MALSSFASLGFWAQAGWNMFAPLYSATVLHLSATDIGLLATSAA